MKDQTKLIAQLVLQFRRAEHIANICKDLLLRTPDDSARKDFEDIIRDFEKGKKGLAADHGIVLPSDN